MDIKTHSCAQKGKSLSESIKFPTLLEAIERVVELSKDSKMGNDFLQNASLEIGLIATASQNNRRCCFASAWSADRVEWTTMTSPATLT